MTLLSVADRGDGVYVVDSRLIAAELGIQHKNFLATIDKYLDELEEDWGRVAFETLTLETSGGKQDSRVAYLTKEQSELLMTYSKNTDQVRRCKRNLVKAFSIAKQVISRQAEELEKLRLQLELARTQERLLSGVQTLESIAPGLGQLAMGRQDVEVERIVTVERHALVNERGQIVYEHAGQSPTTVAKTLGMKAAKDLKAWLESINRLDLIDSAKTIIDCQHIKTDNIKEIRRLWSQRKGNRQKLLGEG